jgi:hypothetical protein
MKNGRKRNPAFAWEAFAAMAGALVLSPIFAALDVFHSYLPFLILRFCAIGFAFYGSWLAKEAGGFRQIWRGFYLLLGLVFAFAWGLPTDVWALIDAAMAAALAVSALFLRTTPGQEPVNDTASKRAGARAPRTRYPVDSRSSVLTVDGPRTPRVHAASRPTIYEVAVKRLDSSAAIDALRSSVGISATQLDLELYALRVQAAHYAIYMELENDAARMTTMLTELYAGVDGEALLPICGQDLRRFVHERGQEYIGAMGALSDNEAFMMLPRGAIHLHFTGQVPHDVGALFEYHCGAPSDSTVRLSGALAFTEAVQAARAHLQGQSTPGRGVSPTAETSRRGRRS